MIKLKEIVSFLKSQYDNKIYGHYDEEANIEGVLLFQSNIEVSRNILYLTKDTDFNLNYKQNILSVVKNANVDKERFQIETIKSSEEVYQMICNFIFSEYRLYEKKCNLYDRLCSSNDINEILNTSESYLNNPIFILDTSYRIIGYSKTASSIEVYTQKYKEESYLLTNVINAMKRDKCIDNIYNSDKAFFQYSDKNFIFSGIRINNVTVSYICVLEKDRKFINNDLELVSTLAQILSIQMQRENLFINSSGLEEEYYLMDLLNSRIDNVDYAKQRLNDIGFTIYKNIIIITIPYNQIYQDYRHNFGLKQLMNTGKSILGNCITAYYEEKIILLISREEKNIITKNVKEKFIDFLKFNNLKAGISITFNNIFDTKKFYIQAVSALELSKRLNEKKDMCYFNDYIEYYLFYMFETLPNELENIQLRMLINPLIYELMEIDKNNNTELLKTLMSYLECNRNANATSKKLNIHCSTFFYRFHKIEELLDISLNDSEILYKLELSLKILKYQSMLDF